MHSAYLVNQIGRLWRAFVFSGKAITFFGLHSYSNFLFQLEKLEPLFAALEEMANAHRKTMAQMALNWLATKDECILPIPGAKNASQASENAGALGWRLTEEEHARFSQASW